MKRRILLVLLALLVLSLAACSQSGTYEPETISINVDNQPMTVTFDPDGRSGTILAENGTYVFSYSDNGSGTAEIFSLEYPDGEIYSHTYTMAGNVGTYGSASDYSAAERQEKGYVDGLSMSWALENAMEPERSHERTSSVSPLVGLLFLGLGIWNLISPYTAWYLSHGWYYKDAEPSDMAIFAYRLGGGIAAVAGVVFLIMAF